MLNSDQDQSGTAPSLGKKVLCLLFQYVAEKGISYLQTDNQASGGRATDSRGRARQHSENPHQNRNFRQNSGQNRQHREAGGPQSGGQRAGTHVKKSSRGGSFHDPATPHSLVPRGNGGYGGRGSGGRGGGGRGGAHHVTRQTAATTAALATTGSSGQASRPTNNSCSVILKGSSANATHVSGATYQSRSLNQCSVHISWPM